MLLDQMTDEIYAELHEIWEGAEARLPDALRDPNILDYWLFQDGGATQFHVVDQTTAVLVVGEIQEGLSATVLMLNPEVAEPGQILRELRKVMQEFDLKRLTANVPGPVKDIQRVLKEVGFRREGHLRRATFWNDRLCGMDIYGMYKDQPRLRRQETRGKEEAKNQNGERGVIAPTAAPSRDPEPSE